MPIDLHIDNCFQIGTGLRIALSQGLHRGLASHADERDPDASRLRSVWWTLYILDRKFSSMMGAPSSIHDSDISVPLPASHNSVQKASALGMHVKLSRLIAMVLDCELLPNRSICSGTD